MTTRDLFGVVVRGIGLWLFVHGVILLSILLFSLIITVFSGGGGVLTGHGLIQNFADPLIYLAIGAILLFCAEGLVTTIYGEQAR